MKIWVDADACPNVIKDILFRASARTHTPLFLVANTYLTHPKSHLIRTVVVEKGFDSADNYIVHHLEAQDLVITADVPLAAEVIEKKAAALNPRGELYNAMNIKQRLSFRDMNEQVRAMGEKTKAHASFSIKEKTAFANALDKWLAQNVSKK